MNKLPILLSAFAALTIACGSAAVTETFTFNGLNLAIPDGNPSGLANLQTITPTAITSIESITISINLAGTYNGDLYVYLAHGSGLAQLINRVGTMAGDPFGYSDDGFSVTFDDAAPADIHTYRNSSTPAPGSPLNGTWQPDGRTADPAVVTNLSPRTALLGTFAGANPAGEWTLFVADLSSGETHMLQNYSISITGVPEPAAAVLFAAGSLLMMRRRR